MNGFGPLLRHALRERLASANRLFIALAVLLVLMPVVQAAASETGGTLPENGLAVILALIFGSGLIGPEAGSGVLQLVLARPVTRPAYVLARWSAGALLAAGCGLAATAAVAGVMAAKGHPPAGTELAASALAQVSVGVGLTAVLAALSAATTGFTDLRLWVLGVVLAQVLTWTGKLRGIAWLERAGAEVVRTLMPALGTDMVAGAASFPVEPVLAWTSTVAVALAAAIWLVNRREVSYGTD